MADPIAPEAYIAIAAAVHSAVTNHRDKKPAQHNDKAADVSAKSSESSLTLPADELLTHAGLKVGNEGYVQWTMHNSAHPRNWSRKRKAYDFGLILFLEFFMSAISAVGIPASFDGPELLGYSREVGLLAFTTIYLLGQALAALLLSPYSSRFGRRPLYIGSASLYSVFCLPVAATSNIAGVFVGRLLTGAISAIPAGTTRLSIEDLFDTEARMWAFFSWALATNLGLVLGPIYAGYVSTSLSWRWAFYLATIIIAVTGILMYFIRESNTSLLLERTVAAIHSHRADLILPTAPTTPRPSVFQPLSILFTNQIVFLSSLANGFSSALLYLFAVAFPPIYAHYGWNRQKTMLIFLFIALGLFLSTLTRFHERHTIRKNQASTPNLLGLAIGAPALAMALWWFAWTIPSSHIKTIAWPASAISLILLGYAVSEYSTALPRYVLESRSHNNKSTHENAPSASFAALLSTRALLSALFPLFTQQMFENLGNNVAGSVLAALATAFCLLPILLIIDSGKKERRRNGSSPSSHLSSGHLPDEESAQEVKKVEIRVKPKKTVRWEDEETDSSASSDSLETKKTSGDETDGSTEPGSEISTVETRDFADAGISHDDESGDGNENDGSRGRLSRNEERVGSAEMARVEMEGSGDGITASSSSRRSNRREGKKQEKEKTRVDDYDDGARGFMGMDLERLVYFPYL